MASIAKLSISKVKNLTALGAYALLVVLLGLALLSGYSELDEQRASLSHAQEQLQALREQQGRLPEPTLLGADLPPGSVLLSGDKVSIASAEFQRRVAVTVTNSGGTVLSSQLERQDATEPSLTDITLAVECEIEQDRLPKLLYDLESQTPFIFIEGLNIRQRSEAADRNQVPHLRASLRLLGHWRETRS